MKQPFSQNVEHNLKEMKIVIYIYNGLTMLDAIGPYEVLRNIPNAEVIFV